MACPWESADNASTRSARALQSQLLAQRRPSDNSSTSDSQQPPAAADASSRDQPAPQPNGAQNLNPTEVFKGAWLKCWRLPECEYCADESAAIDLVFRAFLLGWEEAFSIYHTHCRHWVAMRAVDEGYYLPMGMDRRERFALLYISYLIAAVSSGKHAIPPAIVSKEKQQPKGLPSDQMASFRNLPSWMKAR